MDLVWLCLDRLFKLFPFNRLNRNSLNRRSRQSCSKSNSLLDLVYLGEPKTRNAPSKAVLQKKKNRTCSFGTDSTIGIRDSAIDLILITKAAHAHPNWTYLSVYQLSPCPCPPEYLRGLFTLALNGSLFNNIRWASHHYLHSVLICK